MNTPYDNLPSSIHTIELIEAGFEVEWRPKVERVVVKLTTGVSIHLTHADAAQLAEALTDAVRTAEHHQDQDGTLAEFDANRLRRDQKIGQERRKGDAS